MTAETHASDAHDDSVGHINAHNRKGTQLSGMEIHYNRTLGGIFLIACRTPKSPRMSSVPPSIVSKADVRRY